MNGTGEGRQAVDGRGRAHALVIGGGVAGLVCAEVLSRHFAHVTLLERDRLQGRAAARRGVPQAL
ncbi:MAG: hypothetical protein QOK40_3765, partial [Miltoncostaeaceae bacterium]|nr:hypothetical protein [Miltoncostaeaceae bacterium]